jgi:flagellar biogenesis protein FliO
MKRVDRWARMLASISLIATSAMAFAQGASSAFPGIPLQRDEASGGSAVIIAWTLVGLIALAAALVLVRTRFTGKGLLNTLRAEAPVRKVGSISLTAQASIHLVECEGERLLVGVTAQSITMLSRLPTGGGTQEPGP